MLCGGLGAVPLRAALGPGVRLAYIILVIAIVGTTVYTDFGRRPVKRMIAMRNVTLGATALLVVLLVVTLAMHGWHGVAAGDMVYIFTLLSALDFLPERSCAETWRLAYGSLRSALAHPRPVWQPPEAPAIRCTLTAPATSDDTHADGSGESRQVSLGQFMHPSSVRAPWPLRHSTDGSLQPPQPPPQHGSSPVCLTASAMFSDASPDDQQQQPRAMTRSFQTTLGHTSNHPDRPSVELRNLPASSAIPAGPFWHRVVNENPVPVDERGLLSQSAMVRERSDKAAEPLMQPGGGRGFEGARKEGSGRRSGGFEALAANALVLDSLEPRNPRCADAAEELRGIGLHTCNPLMHELQRRPSGFAADALQRFGLQSYGSSAAAVAALASAATGRVNVEVQGERRRVCVSAGDSEGVEERSVRAHVLGCSTMQAHTHGVHACVWLMASAAVTLLWQGIAFVFWVAACRRTQAPVSLGRSAAAAETPAAGAQLSRAHPGMPEASDGQAAGGRTASAALHVYTFLLFFKVHAFGWMRIAQVAWYACCVTINACALVCASCLLRQLLRTHGKHACMRLPQPHPLSNSSSADCTAPSSCVTFSIPEPPAARSLSTPLLSARDCSPSNSVSDGLQARTGVSTGVPHVSSCGGGSSFPGFTAPCNDGAIGHGAPASGMLAPVGIAGGHVSSLLLLGSLRWPAHSPSVALLPGQLYPQSFRTPAGGDVARLCPSATMPLGQQEGSRRDISVTTGALLSVQDFNRADLLQSRQPAGAAAEDAAGGSALERSNSGHGVTAATQGLQLQQLFTTVVNLLVNVGYVCAVESVAAWNGEAQEVQLERERGWRAAWQWSAVGVVVAGVSWAAMQMGGDGWGDAEE